VPEVSDPEALEAAEVGWRMEQGRLQVKVARAREVVVRVE